MSYTIKDVLDKLIDIEKEMSKLYSNISNIDNKNYDNFKVLCKVMAREEGRHVAYFDQIKSSITVEDNVEIDIFTYDKISQAIAQFKSKIDIPNLKNIKELIEFMVNFEKENAALLINLRGKLVKKSDDTEKDSYKILTTLIEEENKHIKSLLPYCSKWLLYKTLINKNHNNIEIILYAIRINTAHLVKLIFRYLFRKEWYYV